MGKMRAKLPWGTLRGWSLFLTMAGFVYACATGVVASAQVATRVHDSPGSAQLLSLEEGRSIVDAAWQVDAPAEEARDCSHLVHQIYADAGFEYPYASSREIYAGDEHFARVKNARAGDVIAWPGHVGIVVDPLQHSFYSLVRTGLETQDYESAYWRSRGRPRFYRYKVGRGAVLTTANMEIASPPAVANGRVRVNEATEEIKPSPTNASLNRPPRAVSEKSPVIYGPPAPPMRPVVTITSVRAIPTSVTVADGKKVPTREEVAEGISTLNDSVGSVLDADNPLRTDLPMVVVEKLLVERVEVKHDRGWANVIVDSKALIDNGTVQLKQRQEKVRWELRRTTSGWEAIRPTNRAYIAHDVAVKNFAAQLARLTSSDVATERHQNLLRQESQLASLLNTLLEN